MSNPFSYAPVYLDRGWHPIPLPAGKKSNPPAGTTGQNGVNLTPEQFDQYSAESNIGLRMPEGVLGLDIDDGYADDKGNIKIGGQELAALEGRLGPLPPTYKLNARPEHPLNRKLFFRVPQDLSVVISSNQSDSERSCIDFITRDYRYVVAAPSTHIDKEGNAHTSAWYGPDDRVCAPPRVSDLTNLPEAWVGWLRQLVETRRARLTPEFTSPDVEVTPEITAWGRTKLDELQHRFIRESIDHSTVLSFSTAVGAIVARGIANPDAAYSFIENIVVPRFEDNGDSRDPERVIEDGLVHGLAHPWEPWPPHASRTQARINKNVSVLLQQAEQKITEASGVNRTENKIAEYSRMLGRYGAVRAIDVDTARTLILNAAQACGFERERPGDADTVFTREWAEGLETPITPWPPVEEGDDDPRPDWEVQGGPGRFADELRTNTGVGHLANILNMGGYLARFKCITENGYESNESREEDPEYELLTTTQFRSELSRKYYIWTWSRREDGSWTQKHIMPPLDPCDVVCNEANNLTGVRRVKSITNSPLIKRDASLLGTPGFDEDTRMLYLPLDDQSITVSEEIREEHTIRMRNLVNDFLNDFPFETEADKATYLAAMFTPLLRLLLSDSAMWPIFAFIAHEPGSGKTLLANILWILYGGRSHPPLPKDNEEEQSKVITAIFKTETSAVVTFDNLVGSVNGSIWAALATMKYWSGRILGNTKMEGFVNDKLWTVTGNNLQILGDLPRRFAVVNIDPAVPLPWTRTGFKWSLPNELTARRGEVLSALLSLVRGWVLAGMPLGPDVRKDSYGEWHQAVQGLVTWAGFEGEVWPKTTIEEIVQNSEYDEWTVFGERIIQEFGHKDDTINAGWFTSRDVTAGLHASLHNPIARSLPGFLAEKARTSSGAESSFNKSLGMALNKISGKWWGSPELKFRIVKAPKKMKMRSGVDKGKIVNAFRVEIDKDYDLETLEKLLADQRKPNIKTAGVEIDLG